MLLPSGTTGGNFKRVPVLHPVTRMRQEFELTLETATGYLREQNVLPEGASPRVTTLGGGVSNHVVQVSWSDDCLVVKQPLPNLAVDDDWPADVARVHNEAAAARAYADVLEGAGLDARVPDVQFEDREANVIGIGCAPSLASIWKQELLDGRVDLDVAEAVGQVLGAVHAATTDEPSIRETFGSKRPFDQLRIDPYHRTTARRHPDVADYIRDEIDRIMSVEQTLVHGDYSPKNVLVDREGHDVPWILDFEVAHWGDPAFDTAFMCNHLFIKSIYNHANQPAYHAAVRAFWEAYSERVGWDVEAETVRELGVLMLARVDGKSPVEYVSEGPIADALRASAKRSLIEEIETLEAFAVITREEAAGL